MTAFAVGDRVVRRDDVGRPTKAYTVTAPDRFPASEYELFVDRLSALARAVRPDHVPASAPSTMPQRDWDKIPGKQEHKPHPASEVPMRTATEGEIPARAKKVRDFAIARGWDVRTTYARGTRPGPRPKLQDTVALRMSRDRDQLLAFALWTEGYFSLAGVLYPDKLPA